MKLIGFGLVNYLIRFIIGAILFQGVKMNPEGFAFGFILTAVALVAAYILMRFVMKPRSMGEALTIALVWIAIAFAIDIISAGAILKITIGHYLSEPQFWTRLLAILVVVPFVLKRS
jgi:glucan phosphoethanolaminetransferase (alkaline phosphatase superfamily)